MLNSLFSSCSYCAEDTLTEDLNKAELCPSCARQMCDYCGYAPCACNELD